MQAAESHITPSGIYLVTFAGLRPSLRLTHSDEGPSYSVPIRYELSPKAARAMIILSKLADYGVIVATHLAADPDRQLTAAAVGRRDPAAARDRRQAPEGAGACRAGHGDARRRRRLSPGARGRGDLGRRGRRRDRRRYRVDAMLGPCRRMRAHQLLPDPAALGRDQPRGRQALAAVSLDAMLTPAAFVPRRPPATAHPAAN